MFFFLSKFFYFLIDPVFLFFAFVLYLFFRVRFLSRKVRRFYFFSMIIFYLFSNTIFSGFLLSRLERSVPDTYQKETAYDVIVVLSGYVNILLSNEKKDKIELNAAADRWFAGMELLKQQPRARLIFSGGNGSLNRSLPSEARLAKKLASELFSEKSSKIFIEPDSKNTYENALETSKLVRQNEKIVLVTSAFHMFRSLGAFHSLGLSPDTLAVDYRTQNAIFKNREWFHFLPSVGGLVQTKIFFKEIVGIIAYALNGYFVF